MSLVASNPGVKGVAADAVVGVGLRHPHYRDALEETGSIDFVEIHAENFFASGGAIAQYAQDLLARHAISLHGVSMGLGSAAGINEDYLKRLQRLCERLQPMLISDHACFCWSSLHGQPVHAGDLLPVVRTPQSLEVFSANVNHAQQVLGRELLVENITSYLPEEAGQIPEPEYLSELCHRTGCRLLVDLNNLLVNAINFSASEPLEVALNWLAQVPAQYIGQYHLAGHSAAAPGELVIDDHAHAVSAVCWQLYGRAIAYTGARPTLIEWDSQLPSWRELTAQAEQAREIMIRTLGKANAR